MSGTDIQARRENTLSEERQVPHAGRVELRVDPPKLALRILIFCVACEISFLILDYYVNYGKAIDSTGVRRFFNTAREDGLPSWFAMTQTFLIAITLWITYLLAKEQRGSKWRARGWLVLAAFFSYMAVDDGAQIHERFAGVFRRLVERLGIALDFFPSFSWQLIFLPAFAALGLFTLGFLWHELRRRSSRVLLVFAFSCLGLAVSMDFLEGLEEEHSWNVYASAASMPGLEDWTERRFDRGAFETLVHFSKSVEETIEMLAHSILWFLLLRQLARVASDVHVRFTNTPADRGSRVARANLTPKRSQNRT